MYNYYYTVSLILAHSMYIPGWLTRCNGAYSDSRPLQVSGNWQGHPHNGSFTGWVGSLPNLSVKCCNTSRVYNYTCMVVMGEMVRDTHKCTIIQSSICTHTHNTHTHTHTHTGSAEPIVHTISYKLDSQYKVRLCGAFTASIVSQQIVFESHAPYNPKIAKSAISTLTLTWGIHVTTGKGNSW